MKNKVKEILVTRQSHLHGSCFYMGICEPLDEIDRRIKETDGYIKEAKKLVDSE